MKRFFCMVVCVVWLLSLFGCSQEKENDEWYILPDDVSDIEDFKCVCSLDGETDFLIEGETAKELYVYIREQWENSEDTMFDGTENIYIFLSFQEGYPLMLSGEKPDPEKKVSEASPVNDTLFYGVFQVYENDYM